MASRRLRGYNARMDRHPDTLELVARLKTERAKLLAHIEGLESGRIKFRDEAATTKQLLACRRDVANWDSLIAANEALLAAKVATAEPA
jgi:hypothetical protein